MKMIWSQYHSKVQRLASKANVLGVLVHDYQVRFQPNRQWGVAGMTMRVPVSARSAAEQRRFDRFAKIYTYAMPNQEEVADAKLVLP
jgi:hypothetical protein